MAESKKNRIDFHFKASVLESFLKYIYTRNRYDLELHPSRTVEVWLAADFMQVKLLKEVCEESLLAMTVDMFTLDSALHLFWHACNLGSLSLQTKAVHIITRFVHKFFLEKTI